MGSLSRKVYYALPPSLRLVARWIVYWPQDLLASLSSSPALAPPRRLIFTGAGDFIRMGKMFLDDFISKKIIHPGSAVLDIGSGIGRIAIPLTSYLNEGRYEGFDIMKPGIAWCKKNISSRFPNFQFTRVSLSNDLYQSAGGAADQFVFPYPADQFDVVIATSVFTHMLPDEVSRYVQEMHRVMKTGGKAYLTLFILNAASKNKMKEGGNEFNFRFDHGDYRLLDEKVKSANVAYEEKFLFEKIIPPQLFDITNIEYGSWSTRDQASPIAFQDRVLLTKK